MLLLCYIYYSNLPSFFLPFLSDNYNSSGCSFNLLPADPNRLGTNTGIRFKIPSFSAKCCLITVSFIPREHNCLISEFQSPYLIRQKHYALFTTFFHFIWSAHWNSLVYKSSIKNILFKKYIFLGFFDGQNGYIMLKW